MSEIIFKDEFRTDDGTFRSVFDHQGCRLEFHGDLESHDVGSYPTRQKAVDIIVSQKTGVKSWDMLDSQTARKQLWDIARWKKEGLEIFSGSEEPKAGRLSEDERLPTTTPPRNGHRQT